VDEDMSVAPTAVVESKFVVLLKPGYIVVLKLMAESAFSNPVFSTISEF
jgi:hypothetical protein